MDAETLALLRVIELRAAGVDAQPVILWKTTNGRTLYRAAVQLPDGTIEELP